VFDFFAVFENRVFFLKNVLKKFSVFFTLKKPLLKKFYAIFRPNFFCYKIPCLNSVQKSIFEDFFPEYEAVTVQKPC